MNTLRSSWAAAAPTTGLASWYTPGLVDGFGDRLLMFDNTDTDPLELLRFHPALAAAPEFEEVLRERVQRLRRLSDAAFPAVRAVERLDDEGTLALVSTHTPGKRLSAVLGEPRFRKGLHPAFVTWILSQAIQPLSILQSEGEDIAHGALTADRVILTPGGRVCIAEHVLGSALRRLHLSAPVLWQQFGVIAPPGHDGVPPLDARSDVFQLAVLAVSMLLARRISPADLQERLPALLDECSESASARSQLSGVGEPLRRWLERALQVDDRSYRSAADACADLQELPSHSESRAFEYFCSEDAGALAKPLVTLQLTGAVNGQEEEMANGIPLDDVQLGGAARPLAPVTIVPDVEIPDVAEAFPPESRLSPRASRLLGFGDVRSSEALKTTFVAAPGQTRRVAPTWVAVALGGIALAEAVVIAMLVSRGTFGLPAGSATTVIDSSQRPSREAALLRTLSAGVEQPVSAQTTAPAQSVPEGRNLDAGAATLAQAASRQRSGGVRLLAPIELKVLQGERVLGSSADGPIVTTAGAHQLDLINTALGYRSQRTVTFKAGEITSLTIAVPNGRLSVNAQPWAEVWIDGRSLGETPLANLNVPIGEHELIFRHPQLGERRQNIIVRADTPTRVSAAFDADGVPR